MDIAIPLYDEFTATDVIGPYDVLSRLPGAKVTFVAERTGEVRADTRMLGITADASFADLPAPDVILVGGGNGNRALLAEDSPIVSWVRTAHTTSTWTTSVCTGSLILAAAGILDGVDASTHWLAREELAKLGANPLPDRIVERGKIITAAGVSAGIDMALLLASRLANDTVAQAIQLGIEYDPQPPFDAGSEEKAPADVVALVRQFASAGVI